MFGLFAQILIPQKTLDMLEQDINFFLLLLLSVLLLSYYFYVHNMESNKGWYRLFQPCENDA